MLWGSPERCAQTLVEAAGAALLARSRSAPARPPPPCRRSCPTATRKWRATAPTPRSASSPSAAACRTPTPGATRPSGPRSWARSAGPSEVSGGGSSSRPGPPARRGLSPEPTRRLAGAPLRAGSGQAGAGGSSAGRGEGAGSRPPPGTPFPSRTPVPNAERESAQPPPRLRSVRAACLPGRAPRHHPRGLGSALPGDRLGTDGVVEGGERRGTGASEAPGRGEPSEPSPGAKGGGASQRSRRDPRPLAVQPDGLPFVSLAAVVIEDDRIDEVLKGMTDKSPAGV